MRIASSSTTATATSWILTPGNGIHPRHVSSHLPALKCLAKPRKLDGPGLFRGSFVPSDTVPTHMGRKSKQFVKDRADWCRKLADTIGYVILSSLSFTRISNRALNHTSLLFFPSCRRLSDAQVATLLPLLRDDMISSVGRLRNIPPRNQGRDREENNLAGMLRTLSGPDLEQIAAAVEQRRVGDLGHNGPEIENLALSWRAQLVGEEGNYAKSVTTTHVMGLATQVVDTHETVTPSALRELIRVAQQEYEKHCPPPVVEEPTEVEGKVEMLPEFAAELAALRRSSPTAHPKAAAGPPRKNKAGKRLLQALRPLAAHVVASGGEMEDREEISR